MSALHLVFSAAGMRTCARRRDADDVVVLISDGVYSSMVDSALARGFVLADDLRIRGAVNRLDLPEIDYGELVELCTRHQPIVSWKD